MITILIPTRGRAKQLEKNLQLLDDNTHYPNYEIIVIADVDDEDTLAVCEKRKLICLCKFHREYFAQKINSAFRISKGKYIICLSDDVQPQPYWLEIALDCFNKKFPDDAGVLCFNDCGDYGDKIAIHPFVSREWIDRFQQGRWVLWPDYWHFYGDTEITTVAKHINKYVYCEESKVIHTIPVALENRDKNWWFIRKNIYPGDLAIFKQRAKDEFPGYGPDEIEMPKGIHIKGFLV